MQTGLSSASGFVCAGDKLQHGDQHEAPHHNEETYVGEDERADAKGVDAFGARFNGYLAITMAPLLIMQPAAPSGISNSRGR